MTHDEFAQLVRRMRDAQADYFGNRTNANIKKSIALERQVDDYIKTLKLPPPQKEKELFS